MSDYRAPALVCANGHLLTGDINAYPGLVHNFCPDCGAEAIRACPHCKTNIPGDHYYRESWTDQLEPAEQITKAPRFCGQCGESFPWTTSALEVARDLIPQLELDAVDKDALAESLPDLVRDTPKTRAATIRWSQLLRKGGGAAAGALRDVLINVVSEAVSKAIWGR